MDNNRSDSGLQLLWFVVKNIIMKVVLILTRVLLITCDRNSQKVDCSK